MRITTYRIVVAILSGAGFAAVVLLLIKLSAPLPVSLFLSLLLAPGAFLTHFLERSEDFGHPLLVLATNALIYAAVAYAGMSVLARSKGAETMRLAAIKLAVPVAFLVGLVCIPALNPLWPRGMTELASQEKNLREGLPVGMALEPARAFLRSQGIQFYENTEEKHGIILDDAKGATVTASPGDRVISARFQTAASQFPCGYDMQIVLLFGRDDKLKQQYVHRLRVCP